MASKSISSLLFNPILRSSRGVTPRILRPYSCLPRTSQPATRRFAHNIPKPRNQTLAKSETSPSEQKSRKLSEPHYELTLTCVPCGDRSTHHISKQGYHQGSVLITCPSCRNRHIISDHLNIFGDRKITVEDLMREKGQLVKRGTLGEDGDVEFWEDGTTTKRDTDDEERTWYDLLEEHEENVKKYRKENGLPYQPISPHGNVATPPSPSATKPTKEVPSTRRKYSTESTSRNSQDHKPNNNEATNRKFPRFRYIESREPLEDASQKASNGEIVDKTSRWTLKREDKHFFEKLAALGDSLQPPKTVSYKWDREPANPFKGIRKIAVKGDPELWRPLEKPEELDYLKPPIRKHRVSSSASPLAPRKKNWGSRQKRIYTVIPS
ncbi:DNL zinc finger-domain-containing protein [Hypoxylon trugodes]|uniref:DNL zinc finger-domain-containing protein n=1 Tax=Hypoxylon trugodes TaxID=326681 RepID=UPI00219518D7|nr:DNL zinc finger-domain-containing protein [Hypoxylon trugodes]KAI1383588.1 DNL zinc finger-domain-containing protein [Hypoxylon trugodes]